MEKHTQVLNQVVSTNKYPFIREVKLFEMLKTEHFISSLVTFFDNKKSKRKEFLASTSILIFKS